MSMRAYMLLILSITHLSSAFYTDDGYKIPTPSPSFTFPRDHGSHPEYRIEWWYITGHLHDENQDHYGFQATFFSMHLPPTPVLVLIHLDRNISSWPTWR